MSKWCHVTVTFSKPRDTRCHLKAKSIQDAQDVVCDKFQMASYTSEALANAHILHVYINFKGRNHLVEPIDKKTSRHQVVVYKNIVHLKRKKPEKKKHNRHGLREVAWHEEERQTLVA